MRTRSDEELCSMRAKQQSGGGSESDGWRGQGSQLPSCAIARDKKLQIMPFENEIVDSGIDDEAVEVERPHVVAVGRGPTKLEVEHHVASGHVQHRTWCDACMRARGIAGRHERREPGRDAEDPFVAVDYGDLKCDVTEDDDEDEDDEVAQIKLLILVAKDLKTETYAATCLRERGVSEYATSWLTSLLRRFGYRQVMLQSDGEPSQIHELT